MKQTVVCPYKSTLLSNKKQNLGEPQKYYANWKTQKTMDYKTPII